jgi:hypothetical protein
LKPQGQHSGYAHIAACALSRRCTSYGAAAHCRCCPSPLLPLRYLELLYTTTSKHKAAQVLHLRALQQPRA